MFSMFMLPQRPQRRRAVFDRILAAGIELHFPLENLVIRQAADVEPIEAMLAAANLLRCCPTRIPGDPRIEL
jgi:sporadic carbohydrate cluster protein (TIGR04323 family)